MPVTHIEEKPKDLMQTMVHDQFAKVFDEQERAIQSVANISDAMFGGVTMRKPTLADKLDEAIQRAAQSKTALEYIAARSLDLRRNIEESIRNLDDVLLNLNGYKRDIAAGVEDAN